MMSLVPALRHAGLAGVVFASSVQAQVVATQRIASLARPVFVTAPRGDYQRVFVVEQFSGTTGRIRAFNTSTSALNVFLSITPVTTDSEQGLLGLAFHPDYTTNGKFYVNFTDINGATVIREYRVSAGNPNLADPGSARDLLTIAQPQTNHNGGWIAFGPDGFLYVGMGDGGNRDDTGAGHTAGTGNAQDLTSNLLGKMLRLDVNSDGFPADPARNYAIPPGNPFIGISGDDEIWAYGLRNPWRNSFDRLTGDLWIADVGQDVWEEVNFNPGNVAGRNYGWRCMEATHCTGFSGCTCNAVALTLPVYEYQHLNSRCSITGGYVYRGCAIPTLHGHYIFSDYCTGEILARSPAGVVTTLLNPGATVTSFGEDAYGEIWFTRQSGGRVYKLGPTSANQFVDCNGNSRPDCWDIADGTSTDRNHNGVPDSCDPPCPADFNGDGTSDFFDYDDFVTCFEGGACPPGPPPRDADFNNDGSIDFFDYDDFTIAFEAGC